MTISDVPLIPHSMRPPDPVPVVKRAGWGPILLALFTGLVATASLVLLTLGWQAFRKPYADIIIPNVAIEGACPAQTYDIPITVVVQHTPVVVTVVRTWWDVDNNRTAIPDRDPLYVIYMQEVTVSRTLQVAIPNLPSGRYEYTLATTAVGSLADVVAIPVTVSECS